MEDMLFRTGRRRMPIKHSMDRHTSLSGLMVGQSRRATMRLTPYTLDNTTLAAMFDCNCTRREFCLDRDTAPLPIFHPSGIVIFPPISRTMLKQNSCGRILLLFNLGLMTVLGLAPARAQQKTKISEQLYIEVSALGSIDYFYDHKMGLQKAGETMGVKTEYVGPAELDISAMVTAFEQAIARKPNGIIVVGFESSLNAIVDKATQAGVPVVTVDADLPGSTRVAFVGTGNLQAGYEGGKKLAQLIGGKGKVALMTKPGQSNLEERIAGYKKAFSETKGVELVQIADTQSDPAVAAQAASSLLQRYPDLAGIGCVEAAGGSGAATAVSEAGKKGTVKIVAMDRGNEVLQGIKDGVISASVAQQTALMPFYALQILYNLNNHPVPISSDNQKAGVAGVPAVVDTGVIIVDDKNYQYFFRK
jgi:ribose transport system substrate-binding protein